MAIQTRRRTDRLRMRGRIGPLPILCVLVALAALILLVWRSWSWPIDGQARGTLESTPLAHDVAVLSVDFDPPLGSVAGSGRQRALLAVVDNRGTESQAKLLVEAEVVRTSDGVALGKLVEPITTLTPGEVRVVRFERIGQSAKVEPSQQTTVVVRVRPTTGDGFPDDSKSLVVDWASVLKVD